MKPTKIRWKIESTTQNATHPEDYGLVLRHLPNIHGYCAYLGMILGTMGPEPEVLHITPEKGSLYSVSSDGKVKHYFSLVSISNGLAWNSDNTKLYYIDSPTRKIRQFDFDLANGEISIFYIAPSIFTCSVMDRFVGNEKVIFSLEEAGIDGYPDGQTIDTDGNLWVAVFDGYKVIKINPRKYNDVLETVDIPAKQVIL